MNNYIMINILAIALACAGLFVVFMWLGGVIVTLLERRRKPDSFITQEMKRLESKGKTK